MGLSSSRTNAEDLIQDCFEDPKRRKLVRKFCSEDVLKYQKGYPVSVMNLDVSIGPSSEVGIFEIKQRLLAELV